MSEYSKKRITRQHISSPWSDPGSYGEETMILDVQ